MGPPGGFDADNKGWYIYQDVLYMAINSNIENSFFDGNMSHITDANNRWIQWFGSLNEGILNFLCLTGTPGMQECQQSGQPLAPAKNAKDEIYPILKWNEVSPFVQTLRGV
eukprot:112363_1